MSVPAEEVWPPGVRGAAERGTARLMALQDDAGRWEGEVVWCPVIAAQVVLTYAIMRRPLAPERAKLILRQFTRRRRPDGGWGLHPESHSYLFVTTLGSFAQRYVKRHGLAPLFRHDSGAHGYDLGGNIGRRQSCRS
jgi:hypothetical protein